MMIEEGTRFGRNEGGTERSRVDPDNGTIAMMDNVCQVMGCRRMHTILHKIAAVLLHL